LSNNLKIYENDLTSQPK